MWNFQAKKAAWRTHSNLSVSKEGLQGSGRDFSSGIVETGQEAMGTN